MRAIARIVSCSRRSSRLQSDVTAATAAAVVNAGGSGIRTRALRASSLHSSALTRHHDDVYSSKKKKGLTDEKTSVCKACNGQVAWRRNYSMVSCSYIHTSARCLANAANATAEEDPCSTCGVHVCDKHQQQHHHHIHNHTTTTNNNKKTTATSSSSSSAAAAATSDQEDDEAYPCWNCGMNTVCHKLFCSGCDAVQPVQSTTNYYNMFGCPMSVWVDTKALEYRFKDLQKQLHPDLYSNKTPQEKELSTANSSAVNIAYQTLRDPLERVRHLLKLVGVSALEEDSRTAVDPMFLMEVMEIREKLEDVNNINQQELGMIVTENREAVKTCLQQLEQQIAKGDMEAITTSAVRLQYLSRIMEKAEDMKHQLEDNP